jgi:predicted nucleic acid-binding protein
LHCRRSFRRSAACAGKTGSRKEQYRQLKYLLLLDIQDVAVCDLNPAVMGSTISCLESNAVRAMDAIHVGSAATLKADVFVSADVRQIEAAERAGLRVAAV